ncbi:Integral membrane protein, partial [Streptomyces clavuligerus]
PLTSPHSNTSSRELFSMSAESTATGQNEHFLRVFRRRFHDWRGQRPFWAGLFTLLGGIPIAYFPYASLSLGDLSISMATTAGAGSLIIGVLLVTLGLTMWFHHIVRVFAGVASILLALISLPIANLGGFVVGFLLALVGGGMSLSWVPGEPLSAEDAVVAPGAAEGGRTSGR